MKHWNPQTGERLYTLSDAIDGINSIAISPDGKQVAAGGIDKTIRIWALGANAGELRNTLIAHEDVILQVAWSPDGATLLSASADRTINFFDSSDLTERKSIPNQPDWVLALRFAAGGKRFAAGRYDGSLTFYDVTQTAIPKVAAR